jgi:hypothetical protein
MEGRLRKPPRACRGLRRDDPYRGHGQLQPRRGLYPVARRLGGQRLAPAWATKAPNVASLLRVEAPQGADLNPELPVYHVRTTSSVTMVAWRREVHDALIRAGADLVPDGPVELQIAFAVGPSRAWENLWRQPIESLDPLLGRTYPQREWNPRDGRVVRLGLHWQVDGSLGHDVELAISAHPFGVTETGDGTS